MDGTGGSSSQACIAITPDGDTLPGEVRRPAGTPRGAATLCHPHPDYGGDRFNIVIEALFAALPAAGFAAARFDFRRPVLTGDTGRGVRAELDVGAMLDATAAAIPGVPLALAGYSFGAAVGLAAAGSRDDVTAIAAIAPPAAMLALDALPTVPTLIVVPAHDQFGPPGTIGPLVAGWPEATVVTVESADHFLAGRTALVARHVVDWFDRHLPPVL
ncbi:MAG: hypothetical protein ACK5OX_09250 [Desertimonas sp.]